MKITESKKYTYELNTDEIIFIARVAKETVGKYTMNQVLSNEWSICFDYYVDMFNTLKKVYGRTLRSNDYVEIHWLLSLLGDYYNKTDNEDDKAMAKALCDALERRE